MPKYVSKLTPTSWKSKESAVNGGMKQNSKKKRKKKKVFKELLITATMAYTKNR